MNVLQLAEQKGLQPYRSGSDGEYACAAGCPSCGKSKDSKRSDRFRIWPAGNHGRGAYWCRQCRMHGDNIQFLIDFDNKPFKEACEILKIALKAAHARTLAPPPKYEKPAWEPKSAQTPAEAWQLQAGKFLAYSQQQLQKHPAQLDYLASRGIDADRAAAAGLGYCPEKFFRTRESWGLPDQRKDDGSLRKLCLPAGIVIPCFSFNSELPTPNSKLIRLRIRTGEKDMPYFMVPGSSHKPMIIPPAQPSDLSAWAVVEAELDGHLLASAAADLPGLGIYAVGNTSVYPTADHVSILRSAFDLLIAMDFDGKPEPSSTGGGPKAQPGAKASEWWLQQFSQAVRWPVPVAKDPGDWFKEGASLKDISTWLRSGLSPRFQMAMEHVRQSRMMQQVKAGEAVVVESEVDPRMAALMELQKAMLRFDARLDKRTGGIFIKCRTTEGEATMSELVYADGKHIVWSFIEKHPSDIVTASNFWDGLK